MLDALSSFKDINMIIINKAMLVHYGPEIDFNLCIEATKQRLKDLAPSKERRYIRIWHKSNCHDFQGRYLGRVSRRDRIDISTYVRGYYSEVPI